MRNIRAMKKMSFHAASKSKPGHFTLSLMGIPAHHSIGVWAQAVVV